MFCQPQWVDQIQNRDESNVPIYSITFSPTERKMLAAAGNKLLEYFIDTGDLLTTYSAHEDTIYAVQYSPDGKYFASGSADKSVVVWTTDAVGIAQYYHNSSVQCLAFHPTITSLVSCSASELIVWTQGETELTSVKVKSRILCCDWTNDGHLIAVGLEDGHVNVYGKAGFQAYSFKRNGPVWSLAFAPPSALLGSEELLVVGDWKQTLSFYTINSTLMNEVQINFDPCSISFFPGGHYFLVCGSSGEIVLYSRSGVKLETIHKCTDWLWCCKTHPTDDGYYFSFGSNDGVTSFNKLTFSRVHALKGDRYAYREFVTGVVVHDLTTDEQVMIDCCSHVQEITLEKSAIAARIEDFILVYHDVVEDEVEEEMNYVLVSEIEYRGKVSALVLASQNCIVCEGKRLISLNFAGEVEREWTLSDEIVFIKNEGGARGRECMFLGLSNGEIYKVVIGSNYPILLFQHTSGIRCLDTNYAKDKIALVDEDHRCFIYGTESKELELVGEGIDSVAWNAYVNNCLAYSGKGNLYIRAAKFEPHRETLQDSIVVGFLGWKVHCLNNSGVFSFDIPQSHLLYQFIELRDFKSAFEIASLGVTEKDWRVLAIEALKNLELDIANAIFIRLKDLTHVELIQRLRKSIEDDSNYDKILVVAELHCNAGEYDEAAEIFSEIGNPKLAVTMFQDLKQYRKALKYARISDSKSDLGIKDLIIDEAKWSEENQDTTTAAEIYKKAGDYNNAVKVLGENENFDELIELVREIGSHERNRTAVEMAVKFFGNSRVDYAVEASNLLGDLETVLDLYSNNQEFEKSFALLADNPQLPIQRTMLLYARWLAQNDEYEQALDAFQLSDHLDEALRYITHLNVSALKEKQYASVAYYQWLISVKSEVDVEQSSIGSSRKDLWEMISRRNLFSELYFVYDKIYHFVTSVSGSAMDANTLFYASRLCLALFHHLGEADGISLVLVLIALLSSSIHVGNLRLGAEITEKLSKFVIPRHLRHILDSLALQLKIDLANAYNEDVEDLQDDMTDILQSWTPSKRPTPRTQKIHSSQGSSSDGSLLSSKAARDGMAAASVSVEGIKLTRSFVCFSCHHVHTFSLEAPEMMCPECLQGYVFSFLSFQQLPLVSISAKQKLNISEEEIVDLLHARPENGRALSIRSILVSRSPRDGHVELSKDEMVRLDPDHIFISRWSCGMQDIDGSKPNSPIRTRPSAALLKEIQSVKRTELEKESRQVACRYDFLVNILPETFDVVMCKECNHFFLREELDVHLLDCDCCPLCRSIFTVN